MGAWSSLSLTYVAQKTGEISCFSWAAVGLLLLWTMSSGKGAGDCNDEIPMLPIDPPEDSEHRTHDRRTRHTKFPTRSASMTLPSYEEYDQNEYNPLYSTGPFLGRTPPLVPMSAPIHANQRLANNLLISALEKIGGKTLTTREKFSCPDGLNQQRKSDDFESKNEHLLRSGPLGRCNDPYCTTCPTYPTNYVQPTRRKQSKASATLEAKFNSALYGWIKRKFSLLDSYIPGIVNPHAKAVQRWNKFFVISCLVAIFIDPLFFFLFSVQQENKCIVLNWPLSINIAVVRTMTDFVYLLHMLLQFRMTRVAPETRNVGVGDLVDDPTKVAFHYIKGHFFLDLFIVLPLPQIMILFVLPKYVGSSTASHAKNLVRVAVLLQYIPRIIRCLPLFAGQSASGFIFETAWTNFVLNLLVFVLSGHVVGSCWYLFGLQRVNQCLKVSCDQSQIKDCKGFIDCGRGNSLSKFISQPEWRVWKNDSSSSSCFDTENGSFSYGIYKRAVMLSTLPNFLDRYIYSFFWGFQQISTLAGNLDPSYFVWEVLFTVGIVGFGLLLFPLLIGNMLNFIQSLRRRRLDMQLRLRDVEQWMSHRGLPESLRSKVRKSERFSWAATRGIDEQMLLDNLPDDLRRDIRRHLFTFVKKVRIFALLEKEAPILDAICERLRQRLYIGGSEILYQGGPIDNMVFIVRGRIESKGGDGNVTPLKEGDVCGEELLIWCLEFVSLQRERRSRALGQRPLSNRTVTCLTNVEAFALRAADIEEVTSLFARYLRNPHFHRAIRCESTYWRERAACYIQVVWKYRQKRLRRTSSSLPNHFTPLNSGFGYLPSYRND